MHEALGFMSKLAATRDFVRVNKEDVVFEDNDKYQKINPERLIFQLLRVMY